MKVLPTAIADVLLLEPQVFSDPRGLFLETYHASRFAELGLSLPFVQDNHSASRQGTLRGLHYQSPHAQGKLIRVVRGAVFDVAVDLRRGSPSFGRWVAATLSEENRHLMYVPPGFAHGFYTTSATAEVCYKCTDYYHPECEHVLCWDDPQLAIAWPAGEVLLSDRDRQGRPLAEAVLFAE
jgi:dTDP-4-dehydrorhamnose 3,5-epimerase